MVYTLFVKLECSTVILNGLNDFSYAEEIEIEDLWNWYVFDFPFSKYLKVLRIIVFNELGNLL